MSELTKEVIKVFEKEEDEKILKEVLAYYEFLKWKNKNIIEEDSKYDINDSDDEAEIEIEWFL